MASDLNRYFDDAFSGWTKSSRVGYPCLHLGPRLKLGKFPWKFCCTEPQNTELAFIEHRTSEHSPEKPNFQPPKTKHRIRKAHVWVRSTTRTYPVFPECVDPLNQTQWGKSLNFLKIARHLCMCRKSLVRFSHLWFFLQFYQRMQRETMMMCHSMLAAVVERMRRTHKRRITTSLWPSIYLRALRLEPAEKEANISTLITYEKPSQWSQLKLPFITWIKHSRCTQNFSSTYGFSSVAK